jgi:hypothetical protein
VDPIKPVRPPIQGFRSLFQSPALGIVRHPIDPMPRNVAAGDAQASRIASPVGADGTGAMCRPALAAAEARHGIPAGLLQAIGVVESGRRDRLTGARQPWPWTINAEGEPHIFDAKEGAVAWVRQARERGMQSIDVGCAQVNLKHHPAAFESLEQAFQPAANADYAARFLKELRDTTAGGNWMTAAGQYHSQTPELADGYRIQVQAAMAHELSTVPPVPTVAPPVDPAPPFRVTDVASANGSPGPEAGRVPSAPWSGVGRGLAAYRAAPIQMVSAIRPMTSISSLRTTVPAGGQGADGAR